MPPRPKKTLAKRPKLPIRRPQVESSPSPPPVRMKRAATAPDARARKLGMEGPSTYQSRQVQVTQNLSSSEVETSSSADRLVSSTPDETPTHSPSASKQQTQVDPQPVTETAGEILPREEPNPVGTAPTEQQEEVGEQSNRGAPSPAPPPVKKRRRPAAPREGIRELPLDYFISEKSKADFYQDFHTRPVHIPRRIDFDFLEEHKFGFEHMITMQNWKHFLRREDPIYHELVLIFYWNWDFKTFSSTVKGRKIDLGGSKEAAEAKLGRILKIPHEEDSEVSTTATIFNSLSNSAKYNEGHTVMRAIEMSVPNRLLRQFLALCLLPKAGSTDTVTTIEAQLIWKLNLNRQISIPRLMIESLAHSKTRVNLIIPYGMWWTRVFRHFKVNLTDEPHKLVSPQERYFIGKSMLKRMQIDAEAYKKEQEAKEEAEAEAAAEAERQERNTEQADRGWYPGSWEDRIQGEGQSWIPWDGARSNFPTQASGPSHPAPRAPLPHEPPPVGASPLPDLPTASSTIPEVSMRYVITILNAMQASMLSQFNSIHSSIARIDSRLNTISERQASLETNQNTFSAQLASMSPLQPATATPPPPPPPPADPPGPLQ